MACKNSFLLRDDLFIIRSLKSCLRNQLTSIMVPKGNRIYINTWHGIPFKVLGELEKFISKDDRNWFKNVKFDYFCACSEYDRSIFKKVFPSSSGNIVTWGLPRDEIKKEFNKEALRKKIGIPDGRRVVLYAPTFRDAVFYERKSKINGLGISELPKWMQYRLENGRLQI
ncbi:CDP-glycerol glycerophosphotransferase family protein [Levilactobacillus brevis]|uniref:CDP-glycerol glycerophosphotransferase family protein n=1 Tax=Levilactobacillus brevis TaxID=1580 RepID=UPI00287FC37D|nr:CDP-glycerol glycerophosphotransferase family protein [Levilactobacillus brevis]